MNAAPDPPAPGRTKLRMERRCVSLNPAFAAIPLFGTAIEGILLQSCIIGNEIFTRFWRTSASRSGTRLKKNQVLRPTVHQGAGNRLNESQVQPVRALVIVKIYMGLGDHDDALTGIIHEAASRTGQEKVKAQRRGRRVEAENTEKVLSRRVLFGISANSALNAFHLDFGRFLFLVHE
jgi:hypothetical protein